MRLITSLIYWTLVTLLMLWWLPLVPILCSSWVVVCSVTLQHAGDAHRRLLQYERSLCPLCWDLCSCIYTRLWGKSLPVSSQLWNFILCIHCSGCNSRPDHLRFCCKILQMATEGWPSYLVEPTRICWAVLWHHDPTTIVNIIIVSYLYLKCCPIHEYLLSRVCCCPCIK